MLRRRAEIAGDQADRRAFRLVVQAGADDRGEDEAAGADDEDVQEAISEFASRRALYRGVLEQG